MRLGKTLAITGCLLLAACAGNKPAAKVSPPVDYVEIQNPAFTMTADQPATIWVPRSYVDSGIPRGSEVVQKGVEKVFPSMGDQQTSPQASAAPQASVVPPAPATRQVQAASAAAPPKAPTAPVPQAAAFPVNPHPTAGNYAPPVSSGTLKHRIVVIEIGQNGLTQPLQEHLGRTGALLVADSSQAEFLAQSAKLSSPEAKSGFAVRLQQEYNVNEVVYVSTTGVAAGKNITAEVYDTMGGGLLRGIDAAIPAYKDSDKAARDAAVVDALTVISSRIRELVALLPWYSRISAVNGNRAYVPVGKEGGLRLGQALKVYHGGKFMKGLGFAPGSKVGILEVEGFVGPNGAFCTIRDGQGIEAADVVSAE